MSLDKVKAMRNAERFLAQGKIRAAINEYKRVVENDPKDFSSLNMLGDLYAKASDNDEAVKCFTQVAEHYSKQGFAQKAIAIYNKISRLTPDSLEVSAKLAQLYQMKGSVAEARSHYNILAEQYSRHGRKSEALVAWTQIAKLDPNNTDICLKIADAYWQEEQKDEAANAFIEAGKRLSGKKQFESAITVYSRALEINPNDLIALKGVVDAQISLGYVDEAAVKLEEILEKQPYNRDIIYLLVDCYIDTDKIAEAEKAVIKLVEQEPANYQKCLDVVQAYLKKADLSSASRILNIISEHLLVGGQADELEKWISEILAKDPEQLDGLRLMVRFYGWQRDESELKQSLERLAESAKHQNSVEDERYALSQLIMIVPQNRDFAQRLQELNEIYGTTNIYYEPQIPVRNSKGEIPTFESYARLSDDYENDIPNGNNVAGYEEFSSDSEFSNSNGNGNTGIANGQNSANGSTGFHFADEIAKESEAEENKVVIESNIQIIDEVVPRELSDAEMFQLQQEIEGIDFYVSQGYKDLAEKTVNELEQKYGKNELIEKVRAELNHTETTAYNEEIKPASSAVQFNPMDEFKTELGFEEGEAVEEGDYDTHFHLGTAYNEMGLTEDAIREFQDAVKFVNADDGTRRFFLCCNMLGHCFMEKQMPNLGLMWFSRAMETKNLNNEEVQGLRYELANALEMGGEREKAVEYFEKIYADNVDYRDVSERLQKLQKK